MLPETGFETRIFIGGALDELTTRWENKICIVTFDGKLTYPIKEDLKQYFSTLIKKEFQGLIFNGKKTAPIDSSGFGFLISTQKQLHQNQIKFVICELQSVVLKHFFAMQIEKTIPLFATEEEALKFF
ncbi:MAG: STAS domain-containing protein [SAR324 cluster bacterium]|nr:STAS domain-containing protein [SAR324 cluster bacterium]